MLQEIDLPGIATRAILNKIWTTCEDLRSEDGFPVDVCKNQVVSVLKHTMTKSMLASIGYSKEEFEDVSHEMVQSVMDIGKYNFCITSIEGYFRPSVLN